MTEFSNAFESLTGHPPFPWQEALYGNFAAGEFPEASSLPTGLGKTSIIAVWQLALAEQAGYADELVEHAELDWRDVGYWPGADRVDRYFVPQRLRGYPRYRVRVRWKNPRPVAAGGGRYADLGVFAAEHRIVRNICLYPETDVAQKVFAVSGLIGGRRRGEGGPVDVVLRPGGRRKRRRRRGRRRRLSVSASRAVAEFFCVGLERFT